MSTLTCHLSLVTCQVSPVTFTCHLSPGDAVVGGLVIDRVNKKEILERKIIHFS